MKHGTTVVGNLMNKSGMNDAVAMLERRFKGALTKSIKAIDAVSIPV